MQIGTAIIKKDWQNWKTLVKLEAELEYCTRTIACGNQTNLQSQERILIQKYKFDGKDRQSNMADAKIGRTNLVCE